MGFKEICPGVPKNTVRDAKCLGFLSSLKNTFNNTREHFDFPTV